jgi:putative drug exporter of the RND superfamily
MLERWVGFIQRKPKLVLLISLLVFLAGGAGASGLSKRVTQGGYESGGTQSASATSVLQNTFHQGDPNLVLLISDTRGVDNPTVAAAGKDITTKLSKEAGLTNVASYWTLNNSSGLRAKDGKSALVMGTIRGSFDDMLKRVKDIQPRYTGTVDGVNVKVGGTSMMWRENIDKAAKDVSKADGMVFPLLFIALVLIFGGLLAALLPIGVAVIGMVLTMALMFLMTYVTDTSNFVVNMATFLGLGLAVDYSLLIVYRYREELARGTDLKEALSNSVRTAGRTVLFSAVTVAVAFSAVLALPFTFIRSMAMAGIATSLLAAIIAVTVLPALLTVLGKRVSAYRILRRTPKEKPVEKSFWHRLAMFVMRRPIPLAAAVILVLVILGLPALGMKLRLPDEQILPRSAEAAQVATTMRTQYDQGEQKPILVVAKNIGDPTGRGSDIVAYAEKLSTLKNVARVDALSGSYEHGKVSASPTIQSFRFAAKDATYLSVVPSVDGYSSAGGDVVRAVRATPAPFAILVGGAPAVSVDTFKTLGDSLPLAGGILAIGMFVLLFLLTGSVIQPIKAIILTTLSLTATFGVLVFLFQDGHLHALTGDVVITGALTWTVPVTVFAMAFGLSMDYQVFMLSRIREEYDRLGDNTAAVAAGLERVGRIVTYAAILISIVFVVWTTSGISYMRAIGFGLPIAILVDATIIRGVLLPALMRLLGNWNWWAPGPLKSIYKHIGIRESVEPRSTAEETPSVVS